MTSMSRRGFLLGLKGLAQPSGLASASKRLRATLEPPRVFLRPPGAAPEASFARRCDGCGACVPACPHGAIVMLDERWGLAEGTAAVLPELHPCRWCDGRPCVEACTRGALSATAPASMGTAIIDEARCLARAGSGCQACYDRCPLKGLGLYHDGFAPAVDARDCVGCGACVPPCPVAAISIRPLDPALSGLHAQLGLITGPMTGQ